MHHCVPRTLKIIDLGINIPDTLKIKIINLEVLVLILDPEETIVIFNVIIVYDMDIQNVCVGSLKNTFVLRNKMKNQDQNKKKRIQSKKTFGMQEELHLKKDRIRIPEIGADLLLRREVLTLKRNL